MEEMKAYIENAEKCTRCGNCQYYCPTYNATGIESYTARGRLELVRFAKNDGEGVYTETFVKRMDQCLLCGGCSNICPAGIKTEEIIEGIRCEGIKQRGPSSTFGHTRDNILKAGSITGDDRGNRLLWFINAGEEIGTLKISQAAEYAYFIGCVPALYPSSYSIPRSFVTILTKAGLDFTLMGDTENCCGYPLIIGGLPEEARVVAKKNVEQLESLGIKSVITTCPSCYHAWTEYYPRILGYRPNFKVLHGTQIMEELIDDGRLRFKEVHRTVTFHDPCDLGRKSGIYDAPRRILSSIPGIGLIEMKFSRDDAMCCGGGGNLEMTDSGLGNKVAQNRVGQAMDTGAKTIISACQQCKRTLTGGARQLRARVKVMDISELVLEALE